MTILVQMLTVKWNDDSKCPDGVRETPTLCTFLQFFAATAESGAIASDDLDPIPKKTKGTSKKTYNPWCLMFFKVKIYSWKLPKFKGKKMFKTW